MRRSRAPMLQDVPDAMTIITYQLTFENQQSVCFKLDTQHGVVVPSAGKLQHCPAWTRLEVEQCQNCPLSREQWSHCPASLAIHEIVALFADHLSIVPVDVQVTTKERSYCKKTDLQSCLHSILGLAMATSQCPILSRLRPMAYFHLPFASLEETLFRLVSTYLLKQYLLGRKGTQAPDWDLHGIESLYKELEVVNHHLLKRIRLASKEDANINAVQSYCSISFLVGITLEQTLNEFLPILEDGL